MVFWFYGYIGQGAAEAILIHYLTPRAITFTYSTSPGMRCTEATFFNLTFVLIGGPHVA